MTKSEVLTDPTSCLMKADDDEPIFVLRAKDPIAHEIVLEWSRRAYQHHEPLKAKQARLVAYAMAIWRTENVPDDPPRHDPEQYQIEGA